MALHDLSFTPDEPGQQLRKLLDDACEMLELDYAAYAGVNTIDNSVHAIVNYPDAWKEHYLDYGLHEKDPVLAIAARSQAPVHWHWLKEQPLYENVFTQAHDFGIPDLGVTIPVHGPFGDKGMLSVTRNLSVDRWEKHARHIMSDLQQVAAVVHDHVMQQGMVMRSMRAPTLSLREKETLQWIAAGKSQADIADILNISTRTVEVHLRSSRAKLGALSTAQAVARAIGMRMIYPM